MKNNESPMELTPHAWRAASLVKSVRRAIRRGRVTFYGTIAPKRPFNNRANSSVRDGVHSRVNNELKKRIYGQIKRQY